MVPAFVGLLLWPRRKKRNGETGGHDVLSHCLSTVSSFSSDENEPLKKPQRKSFKKRFTTRKASKKTIQEEEVVENQLICYLCGQHCQRTELLDHVGSCLKSWARREEIKPEEERKVPPSRPNELDEALPVEKDAIERFNKQMRSVWLKTINRRCEHCKKTFKAGAYFKHIKTCGVVEEVEVGRVASETAQGTESLVCAKLSRSFTSSRLVKSRKERERLQKPKSQRQSSNEEAPPRPRAPKASVRRTRTAMPAILGSVTRLKKTSAATEAPPEPAAQPAEPKPRPPLKKTRSAEVAAESSAVRPAVQPREVKSSREKSAGDGRHQRRWSIAESGPSKTETSRVLEKSMTQVSRGPRGYTCYLCGRQFGSASLAIHVRQCRQLWKDQEALKRRKRDRRPLPTPPPELQAPLPEDRDEIQEFNNKMFAFWETRSLLPCRHCGRTFNEEAFEKHQRVCTAENPGGPLGLPKHYVPDPDSSVLASSSSNEREPGMSETRPAQYCCYLCGRQYGSQSLFLHIPRCQKLWEDREAAKPDRRTRRPLPLPPPELEGFPNVTLPTEPVDILEFNNAVYEYWDRISLYVCQTCGRSFNEESYEKHQQLCGRVAGDGKFGHCKKFPCRKERRDSTSAESSESEAAKPSSIKHYVCHLCGRKYGSKSLSIHVPHCEKRWLTEEEQKPKAQRRPLPPRPDALNHELPSSPEGVAEFNAAMTQLWETHSLITCKICGRRFNAEAFEKHQKHCRERS